MDWTNYFARLIRSWGLEFEGYLKIGVRLYRLFTR